MRDVLREVLVVAGDHDVRESIRAALTTAGYRVRTEETGIAALTVMAASARPRVVVLDAQLADLDGLDVLRFAGTALSAGWRSGMVLLAAETRPLALTEGWAVGARAPQVLAKPIALDKLVTAVRIAETRQRAVSRGAGERDRQAAPLHNRVGAVRHG